MIPFDMHTRLESNACYRWAGPERIGFADTVRVAEKRYGSLYYEDYRGSLDTAFLLRGLENVTLDFGGAVITLSGRIQPFIIDECRNVTIRNVTIAYDRPGFTEFDVLGAAEGQLRVRPKPGFTCRVENGSLIPYGPGWENHRLDSQCMFLQAFDRETREGRGLMVLSVGREQGKIENPPCKVEHLQVSEDGDALVLTGNVPRDWDEHVSLVLEHEGRDLSSVAVYHSEGVTIGNCRILNGWGMGVLAIRAKNLTLEGLRLTYDELSMGTVTNSADAMHLVACEGLIAIRDSIVEGMIDDALNIHANYYKAESAAEKRLIVCRDRRSHALNVHTGAIRAGDEIALYRSGTLEEKLRCTIEKAEVLDDLHLALTLDRPAVNVTAEDVLENLTTNPDAAIENCRFGKANTHLRLQTRGKCVIRNCESSLPFWLTGDMKYWYEASPVTDMTIENCRFTGQHAQVRLCPEFTPTAAAPFYHRNVRVIGCTFDTEYILDAGSACDVQLIGCSCSDGSVPQVRQRDCQRTFIKDA